MKTLVYRPGVDVIFIVIDLVVENKHDTGFCPGEKNERVGRDAIRPPAFVGGETDITWLECREIVQANEAERFQLLCQKWSPRMRG